MKPAIFGLTNMTLHLAALVANPNRNQQSSWP